jgi:hypothetical protein
VEAGAAETTGLLTAGLLTTGTLTGGAAGAMGGMGIMGVNGTGGGAGLGAGDVGAIASPWPGMWGAAAPDSEAACAGGLAAVCS